MDRHRTPDFLHDGAALGLERPLEAADRLPSERVVERDRGHLPHLQLAIRVFAERMVRLAGGPARPHDPLAPPPLRQIVRGHDRVHHRHAHRVDVRRQRVAGRRQQRAGHQVDLVPLDQLARLGQPDRRNRFVVFDDDLDLSSAGPVADLVQRQQEAVEDVAAVLDVRTRQRREEPDLDRAAAVDALERDASWPRRIAAAAMNRPTTAIPPALTVLGANVEKTVHMLG